MIRVDETDPVGEIEPSFPYRDVTVRRGVDFKDCYDIESEIGRGKFGTVYHCKEKKSGLQLAAKVVTTTRKEDRRSVEREVEIMRRLQHPRLIQLYDALDTGKQIYVILELIQGGELFERVIDDDFVLTERSCAVFMRQICEGIEFVHSQHILHLDMKPENILCLTKEGNRIKIIDFGLARQYDPRKKLQVLFGTPEFVAPEVVNFDEIGFGTDMWSIGVICYVLLSGLSPFMGDTDVETMANVTIAKYDFDHDAFNDISEDAKDFIRCLLVKDKEKRSTATMCRSHRWLTMKPAEPKNVVVDEPAPTIEVKPEKEKKKKKKKQPQQPQKQQPEVGTPMVATSSAKDELDVTKDNLRLFVERWREHPDSPYQLEMDNGQSSRWEGREVVSGHGDNANLELISLRGQSPSPCGSVCSSSLSEVSCSPADKSNYSLAVPNAMVLGLERRASEGYTKTGCRRDQAAQIILAEEIIKLSEHLRTLAMGQPEAQNIERVDEASKEFLETNFNNGTREKSEKTSNKVVARVSERTGIESSGEKRNGTTSFVQLSAKTKTSSGDQLTNNCSKRNEISEKLSSITRARTINGTTFNGTRSYERQDGNVTNFNLKKTSSSSRAPRSDQNSLTVESTSFAIPERGMNNSRVTWKIDGGENHTAEVDELRRNSEIDGSLLNNREIDLSPPWRRARTKHRFGETCRDVPRISNLRDIHKSLNLDEPKSTKDLLLHLLGEWDDNTRPGGGIGRKSISVDWCGEESVARRSMNSLAEYFQSEQQKTTTTDASTNATTPSIHR